jgi:hypothetical protein
VAFKTCPLGGATRSAWQEGCAAARASSVPIPCSRPNRRASANISAAPAYLLIAASVIPRFGSANIVAEAWLAARALVMVTIGELTLQRLDEVKGVSAGGSWVDTTGLVHAAGNDSGSFAQAVATFLLPAGWPPATVV